MAQKQAEKLKLQREQEYVSFYFLVEREEEKKWKKRRR